jgi:glutathione synthase/RimK-type ligase-like ATP-grasp enzyme
LGLGAIPNENISKNIISQITLLSKLCTKALKITFCSVDLIQIKPNKFLVLEVNGGVMMEKYSEHNYKKCYSLYELSILDLFK